MFLSHIQQLDLCLLLKTLPNLVGFFIYHLFPLRMAEWMSLEKNCRFYYFDSFIPLLYEGFQRLTSIQKFASLLTLECVQKFIVLEFIHIPFQPAANCLCNIIWNLILEVHSLLCKSAFYWLASSEFSQFQSVFSLVTALC